MSNLDDEEWLNLIYINAYNKTVNDKRRVDEMVARNKMEVLASERRR